MNRTRSPGVESCLCGPHAAPYVAPPCTPRALRRRARRRRRPASGGRGARRRRTVVVRADRCPRRVATGLAAVGRHSPDHAPARSGRPPPHRGVHDTGRGRAAVPHPLRGHAAGHDERARRLPGGDGPRPGGRRRAARRARDPLPTRGRIVDAYGRARLRPPGHPRRPAAARPGPGIEGLFVAGGHGPYGITLGPASGRIAADAVLGTAPVPQRFRVDRAAVAAATPLVAT